MRRVLVPGALSVGALALFVAFTASRPAVPAFTPLGSAVALDFELSGIEGNAVEIGLARGARGTLFLQFDVVMEGGGAALVLNGAGARRAVAALRRGGERPDWSFLKTRSGEAVSTFSFENQLVERADGGTALRVVYTGTDVPLVRSVRVGRMTVLPAFLGSALGHDGLIRLEPGTYPIDAEQGATITARRIGG